MGAKAREHDGGTLSLSQACYHAVWGYPGKVAAVAPSLGVTAKTLANKLNGNVSGHLLTADEAVQIAVITRDARILTALCEPVGATFHWLSEVRDTPGDLDVLAGGAASMDATNQAIQEVIRSLEDGRVDATEARRINAMVHEAQRRLAVLGQLAERFMED